MYNVSQYLSRCIQSVYNQNLPDEEFELILVNDGSPDDSLLVAKELTKDKLNVKIISQENKGLGGARNTGIENAKGKYILFVDADDYILPNKMGYLFQEATKHKLDILEFGAEGVSEKGELIYRSSKNGFEKPLSGQAYIASMNYMNSACNKLYSTELLKNKNLLFLERVFIEDIEFNTRVFLYANSVLAIPVICAHFVCTSGSITRATSQAKQNKMMFDMIEVITIINEFVQTNYPMNSPALPRLQKRISNLCVSLLNRSMQNANNYLFQKEIIHQLRKLELYPITHKTDSINKDIYRFFANSEFAYSTLCKLNNWANKHIR